MHKDKFAIVCTILVALALAAAGWYFGYLVPARKAIEFERDRQSAAAEAEAKQYNQNLVDQMRAETQRELRQIEANRIARESPIFSMDDARRMAHDGRWLDMGNYAVNWLHYYPNDGQAWVIYGEALRQLNMNAPARDAFLKALSLRRADPVATILLAEVLGTLGETGMIADFFRESMAANPNDEQLRQAATRWKVSLQASQAELEERRRRAREFEAHERDKELWRRQLLSEGKRVSDCAADTPTIEAVALCFQHQEEMLQEWRRSRR